MICLFTVVFGGVFLFCCWWWCCCFLLFFLFCLFVFYFLFILFYFFIFVFGGGGVYFLSSVRLGILKYFLRLFYKGTCLQLFNSKKTQHTESLIQTVTRNTYIHLLNSHQCTQVYI